MFSVVLIGLLQHQPLIKFNAVLKIETTEPCFTQTKSNSHVAPNKEITVINYLVSSFPEILRLSLDDLTKNNVLLKIAVHGHFPYSFGSVLAGKLQIEG